MQLFVQKKYELQLLSGPLKLTQGGLIDKTADGGGYNDVHTVSGPVSRPKITTLRH